MKWSPEYATGIEAIDEQHRMIFQMSEDFQAALETGSGERVYGGLLISLELYMQSHFRFEEACMEKYHCPIAALNKRAHSQFAETLAGFRLRFERAGFDRADALSLMQQIDDWLTKHICRIDIKLRDAVATG